MDLGMLKRILILLMVNLGVVVHETKARPFAVKRTTRNANEDVKLLFNHFSKSSLAKISYYGAYPVGTSACSLDPIPPLINTKKWILAAVSKFDFLDSLTCGTCLRVSMIDLTAREDPEDIYAAVIDKCNDCQKGEINLYMDGKGTIKANVEAIDCMDKSRPDEKLRLVIQSAEKNSSKIQIRNSLLPVVLMECFRDGRWVCLRREADNYFVLEDLQALVPVQFRATSIAGEKIGFSLDQFELGVEIPLKQQFTPFHSGSRVNKSPIVACNNEVKAMNSSKSGTLVQRGNPVEQDAKSSSKDQGKFKNDLSKGGKQVKSNLTEVGLSMQQPLNKSFCKQRQDGSYPHEVNCERFVLCVQGKSLDKICPNSLRYNSKVGVCDWPKNVICSSNSTRERSDSGEDHMTPVDNDDDVYTKKFIGKERRKSPISPLRNRN
ncbi:uncharacterized protein LOC135682254 isoform X2 [Rhopilema esculentum]|uniref:uncharacterized protein LOC135682254 isoform X2 n=1 Tax=Rhopilema esculentum TaxID=499914 RepID=UPI0031D8A072